MARREPRADSPNLVLLQTVLPDYRLAVFEALNDALAGGLLICAGDVFFSETVRTVPAPHLAVRRLTNRFFCKRRVLWQGGAWRCTLPAPVLLAELNPRIASTWLIVLSRRFLGRRTVLWGHHLSRSSANAKGPGWARKALARAANGVVVYTESGRVVMRQSLPAQQVTAAPNALYRLADMGPAAVEPGRHIIYVSRLVEQKRPHLLLLAYAEAVPALPPGCRLVFVGEGPEREPLQRAAYDAGLSDRIDFLGHVSDLQALRRLYGRAVLSVSPGYVGLSAVQSLAFGIPVVYAEGENHSPEVEALTMANSRSFSAGQAESLAAALLAVMSERVEWWQRRGAIADDCAQNYSVEAMVARLREATLGDSRSI